MTSSVSSPEDDGEENYDGGSSSEEDDEIKSSVSSSEDEKEDGGSSSEEDEEIPDCDIYNVGVKTSNLGLHYHGGREEATKKSNSDKSIPKEELRLDIVCLKNLREFRTDDGTIFRVGEPIIYTMSVHKDHCLGSGSFATVYVGWIKGHENSKFAIKDFRSSGDWGKEDTLVKNENFVSVSHKNVCMVYNTFIGCNVQLRGGEDDPEVDVTVGYFQVWELCDCSLGDYLSLRMNKIENPRRDKPLLTKGVGYEDYYYSVSNEEVRYIFSNYIDGLKALHDNNIIHRDLRPENILMKHTGKCKDWKKCKVYSHWVPKIAGFGEGLVGKLEKKGKYLNFQDQRRLVGTAEYACPTQWNERYINDFGYGIYTYDSRCDVFSAGLILFEMVVGDLPFARRQICYNPEEEPEPPHIVRTDLRRGIVSRYCEKLRDVRITKEHFFKKRKITKGRKKWNDEEEARRWTKLNGEFETYDPRMVSLLIDMLEYRPGSTVGRPYDKRIDIIKIWNDSYVEIENKKDDELSTKEFKKEEEEEEEEGEDDD